MRIAESGVGVEDLLLVAHPAAEGLRAHRVQAVLAALGKRRATTVVGDARFAEMPVVVDVLDVRIAVDRQVGNVFQGLGGAIELLGNPEKLGMVVDEGDRGLSRNERRMFQHVFEKADIGLDPADTKLPQGALSALDGAGQRAALRGHLDQHGIEERGNLGPGISGADIQADTEPGRAAISDQRAVIRLEVVLRILRGNPALHREARAMHRRLVRNIDFRILQPVTAGNLQLAAHDIDPGDLLGYRVLDLDPGVDLDEIDVLFPVHQEFDRAGIAVSDMPRDGQGMIVQRLASLLTQPGAGRHLDHFLESPLDGAVPFEKVNQVSVVVAEHLDFDVFRRLDEFFQENRVVPEGLGRFAARLPVRLAHLLAAANHAHAAAAAARDRLQHQRETDALGLIQRNFERIQRNPAVLDDRQAGGNGVRLGPDLVTQLLHGFRRRADEDNALFAATPHESHVLGQESVSRMNCIHAVEQRHLDDRLDVEIGLKRFVVFTDLVSLVRLEAVGGEPVLVGEDADGADAKFGGRPHHANGYFTAIGDEKFPDGIRHGVHGRLLLDTY